MATKIIALRAWFLKNRFRNKYLASYIVLLTEPRVYLTNALKAKDVDAFKFIMKTMNIPVDKELINLAAGFSFECYKEIVDEEPEIEKHVYTATKYSEVSTINYYFDNLDFVVKARTMTLAVLCEKIPVLEFLYQKPGFDFLELGESDIQRGAVFGNLLSIRFLVEKGVDFRRNGNFAIKVALMQKQYKVFIYLREMGADVSEVCADLEDYEHACLIPDCSICWAEVHGFVDAKIFLKPNF